MKNKLIQGALLSFVISLLISCSPKKEEPASVVVDKEQIKKEIQAKENEYAETFNSRVMKKLGYYADDAISFSQNKAPLVGKEAILEYLKEGMESNSNKLYFTTKEVYPSNDGTQVLEIGYYQVLDSTDYIVNSGNYMSLFVKRDGNYVCLRDMSTSDMPLE